MTHGATAMRRLFLTLTVLSIPVWSQPAQQLAAQAPIVVQVQMPPTPPRDVLGYLQALGPLIAVTVAVGVAFMQRHIQKKQLNQSIYDKRFTVYRSVPTYWRNLIESKGEPPVHARQQFLSDLSHATFLFGPEVVQFLDEYYGVTEKYCNAFERLRNERASPFARSGDEVAAVRKELDFQAGIKKTEVFRPYLQIYKPPLHIRLKTAITRLKTKLDEWIADEDRQLNSRGLPPR